MNGLSDLDLDEVTFCVMMIGMGNFDLDAILLRADIMTERSMVK
jgi:hypothetical protein